MKYNILTFTTLLLTITFSTIAQEQTQLRFGLPEGAIARLGNGSVKQIHYSPDGTQLAIATSIGTWIYDTTTWQPIHHLTDEDRSIRGIDYHPQKNTLISWHINSNKLHFWDTDNGTIIRTLVDFASATEVIFNANADTIATNILNYKVRLMDAKMGQEIHVLEKTEICSAM